MITAASGQQSKTYRYRLDCFTRKEGLWLNLTIKPIWCKTVKRPFPRREPLNRFQIDLLIDKIDLMAAGYSNDKLTQIDL